jgi:UDP-glucose 4-epimerase
MSRSSRRVLITGVAGFMGSHIADRFLDIGDQVIGIDNLLGGYRSNVPNNVEFHNVDLGDLDSIQPLFRGVDLVVHTACTAYEGLSVFSPTMVTRNTSHITVSALTASVIEGVGKFVFMSSMARYGRQEKLPFTEDMQPLPQDPYGIAKYASELLIRNICETHGMKYSIVVPHNIIGPRQKYDDPFRNVASIMANRMLQGKQPIIYGDGEQMRCFSFMEDVIDPLMKVCNTEVVDGQVTNIGPDEEFISINELAKRISTIINFELNPIYFPDRPQEVKYANCSAEKARTMLGYQTKTSLNEGLTRLVEWIAQRGTLPFNYHLPIEINNKKTPKTWSERKI